MSMSEWTAAAQAIAAFVAIAVAIWAGLMARGQLQEAQRQRRLSMGLHYVTRYWSVSDDLLHSPKGSSEHREHQHRYLILCEDEFEAARGGWLDPEMWETWHGWLATADSRRQVTQDLDACSHSSMPFDSIRRCLTAPPDHAWQACPARAEALGGRTGSVNSP